MKFLQYLGRSFADTLLLLLGVTGVTFSLMSAYTVPADETQCFLYCLLFSALFSFLFHIRAHGRPVCIAVLLLFALCIFLYRERLYNAVLAFLSVLTDTVRENTNLNLYVDAGTSSRIVLLHRLDEFFCFLPALLACVFGLFWVRLRSFLLCLLIAVPLMGLCVVLIDAAPETAPVLLFAIFCVVWAISAAVRASGRRLPPLSCCRWRRASYCWCRYCFRPRITSAPRSATAFSASLSSSSRCATTRKFRWTREANPRGRKYPAPTPPRRCSSRFRSPAWIRRASPVGTSSA